MRWSQCGGRERYRAKGKIVAEDGVFGPIVRTSFLSVQATWSWRRGHSGRDEGGYEGLQELTLLLLDDLRHRLDHPGQAQLGGCLVEFLLRGQKGKEKV